MYTQRHLSRLDRLVRSTYLLDYTLASMKVWDVGGGGMKYGECGGKVWTVASMEV